jgi:8-oxo-dGTP pyrophosphatase MutT (NUDIX family)
MKQEKSCGCIIIEDKKVLLIKQCNNTWGFPKGHVEDEETEIETAIREVKEETNLDVSVNVSKRYTMEYVTDKGNDKEVVLFMAKRINGKIKPQESEISDIAWVSFDKALELISYENTKEVFKKAIEEL